MKNKHYKIEHNSIVCTIWTMTFVHRTFVFILFARV